MTIRMMIMMMMMMMMNIVMAMGLMMVMKVMVRLTEKSVLPLFRVRANALCLHHLKTRHVTNTI